METIVKCPKRQDCHFKLTPGTSNETSINLSNEVYKFINPEGTRPGEAIDITFKVFKDDFIKALCFIVEKLPLYKTSSGSSTKINYSLDFFTSQYNVISTFFGNNTKADYHIKLLNRIDGRIYLNDLDDNGFNVRKFLIESNSVLFFTRDDNELSLRVETGQETYKRYYDIANGTEAWQTVITDAVLASFILKCVKEQVENDGLVSMNQFIVGDIIPGSPIKIASIESDFSLTGMFLDTTKNDLNYRNVEHQRWFPDEFSLDGHTVYLSTQWNGNGAYQLTLQDYRRMLDVCYPGQYSYSFENNIHILKKRNTEAVRSDTTYITSIIDSISQTGLIYNDSIIKRLCFSLMTKRFVILSGLSGSGKTQLALALAHALCIDLDKQLCFVPVGADWTNREPLLGYPNALKNDDYVLPENGALSLLLEAQKPDNQNKPYFLILDEMNLSVVERYFADFLSAIEAKNEPIHLWNPPKESSSNVPSSVALGRNVFIIGTINVDETTYMFSPKVLDRANVIEFKITSEEMRDFLESNPDTDISKADGKASEYAADFVAEHNPDPAEAINDTLNSFFEQLKKANAEFGYRSAHEIAKFIGIALSADDSENKMSVDEAVDAAIVQKLLPKLHGSKKKLTPILNEMFKLCFDDDEESAKITLDNVTEASIKSAKYKLSAEKIQRMYKWVSDNGFASYAES